MGTLTFPGLIVDVVEPSGSSIMIGQSTFPSSDSISRAVASFGGSSSFISRSSRQEVTTSTATIQIGITIVGVNFNGPVTLTFADNEVNLNDIYIIDEGGFCNEINTITATSTSASGSLVVSKPYSYMKARTNGTEWFAETSTILSVVVNEDGSSTTTNADGSLTIVGTDGISVTTSEDGNTTFTIYLDGSTVAAEVSGNVTSSTTTLADGTVIVAEVNLNGNSSSFTTNPDGSTVNLVESSSGNTSTFTTLVDGTTIDNEVSSNGNTSNVTIYPDGTVESEASFSNGSIDNSTVNSDGSTYSFVQTSSGIVTITNVDVSGNEVVEEYYPWQSYYTVTTTPSGGSSTSETFSPNPYES